MRIVLLNPEFKRLAGTHDAVHQRGEAQRRVHDSAIELIWALDIVWRAPDVYEHRDEGEIGTLSRQTVALVHNDHMIQTLTTYRTNHAFDIR